MSREKETTRMMMWGNPGDAELAVAEAAGEVQGSITIHRLSTDQRKLGEKGEELELWGLLIQVQGLSAEEVDQVLSVALEEIRESHLTMPVVGHA